MPDFETSIDIAAEPSFVFDFLITNDGMTAWMGECADLDPRVGGQFAVDVAGSAVRGEFLEIDPPRRVVVSWGMAGSDDLPPGLSTVAFTLTPIATGTRVDLVHSGLPDRAQAGHARGWAHYLERLEQTGRGIHLGPDNWDPMAPIEP